MWRRIPNRRPIPRDYFPGYALFNWKVAKRALDLHSREEFDLFYIHDFQLLLTGSMLGPIAPKVFRWHIPLRVEDMLPEWRAFLLRRMEDYDAVIVSCKGYRQSLLKGGFRGKVYQVYPHIDPNAYGEPPRSKVNRFCHEFGIGDEDQVLLIVARLDPMKGQDTIIKGLAHIARRYPNLKLVIVGNGSFSSAKRGGLGLPKGLRWKKELDELARSLGVEDRIIFTGFLPWEALNSAYVRSDVVINSSVLEGFGITVLEGWQFRKPVIISSAAGVAELAEDGVNSYIFDPSDPKELAEKIDAVLSNPKRADKIAQRGRETVEQCHVDNTAKQIWDIFMRAVGG